MLSSSAGLIHAFLLTSGTMQDLGTLGGQRSEANSINDHDQIVGWAYDIGGLERAFVFSGGTMQGLGTLSGYAYESDALDVNNLGQIVGWAENANLLQRAFLYDDDAITDLNGLIDSSSKWTLVQATAINDTGQIVGWGTNPNGRNDAFLLTPIPEPSTLALLGSALLAIGVAYLRRRRPPSLAIAQPSEEDCSGGVVPFPSLALAPPAVVAPWPS